MKSKEPKTEILRTRVSPEEREQIEYKALSSYRTVSRYLRDAALDKPIVIINGVDELADELRRVGNNLNQISVGCFGTGDIPKDIVHRTARGNEFSDCHIFFSSSLVSFRSTVETIPALTARVI